MKGKGKEQGKKRKRADEKSRAKEIGITEKRD